MSKLNHYTIQNMTAQQQQTPPDVPAGHLTTITQANVTNTKESNYQNEPRQTVAIQWVHTE